MRRVLMVVLLLCMAAAPCAAKKEIKYAVGVYHFNLQYVAGDTAVENRIIEESLLPTLDLFLAHPTWGADIELQGLLLDVLAERYPEILEKLRTLANRGQVDIVSFHYSDQLFLAYPRRDMEWSAQLNDDAFARNNVKRSPVVFTQEGQFGEGMAGLMLEHGQNVLVLPKNLYRYYQGEQPAAPYYSLRGVNVVLSSRSVDYEDADTKVQLQWTYCDDAELLPTNRATPYTDKFRYLPEALAKYEKELEDLEKQGYKIGNLSDYVKAVKDAGVAPGTLRPTPDGTWQPKDTENVFRWMGDHIQQHERDNLVLTGNVKSRHKVLAAETATAALKAKGKDTSALEKKVEEAWRWQVLAEVSDSTGWTPFPVEIKYSRDNSTKAEETANGILDEVKKALGAKHLEIDTRAGTVTGVESVPEEKFPAESPCPIEFKLEGELKSSSIVCGQVEDGLWEVRVTTETKNWYANFLRLTFPLWAADIIYSPALMDDTLQTVALRDLLPEKKEIYIPAANGLLGLGKDTYIIQKTDTVRLAYRITLEPRTAGIDMRKSPNSTYVWTLYVVRGDAARALETANRMNVRPVVWY